MNHNERNRYNMFIKVKQFGADNAADFPNQSVGKIQFTDISNVIARLDELSTKQAEGFGEARLSYVSKDTARENLRETIANISRTAKGMEYEFTGISEQFRMPRGSSDQKLVATAKSFVTPANSHKADFIRYGLKADFIDELSDNIAAFEATINAPSSARGTHVEATAEIGETIRKGMNAVRILDAVIKNIYRGNVGKLAAWTTASNIEAASIKKKDPIIPTNIVT